MSVCWCFKIYRHTRLEPKENQQRPVNRTYYYVDFRATIDSVKYRMHKVVRDVERKMNKVGSTLVQPSALFILIQSSRMLMQRAMSARAVTNNFLHSMLSRLLPLQGASNATAAIRNSSTMMTLSKLSPPKNG